MKLTIDRRRVMRLCLLAAALNWVWPGAPLGIAGPAAGEHTAMIAGSIRPTLPPVLGDAPQRDGLGDFDFLIGHWQVHLRKRLKPLTGSTTWVEYRGTSATRKIWDDRANTEEFDVDSPENKLHIKAQTLRLYNPNSHQWSIYLVYADKGVLSLPPVVGQFTDGLGEFYDQEEFDGRAILVRYQWFNVSPVSARMEQSFSPDGGKSWEVNWICELTRDKPNG